MIVLWFVVVVMAAWLMPWLLVAELLARFVAHVAWQSTFRRPRSRSTLARGRAVNPYPTRVRRRW